MWLIFFFSTANYIKNSTIICSNLPNIASLCKAEDEKSILLSYVGDTTSAEVTLTIDKKLGVGQTSVMSDLTRNEFEFYRTSGFEIRESISTLSENFKENIGACEKTNFDWGSSADNMWQEEQSTRIKIKTKPRCSTEVLEIVGRCSFMEVRPTEYVRVDICNGILNETVVSITGHIVKKTYSGDTLNSVNNYKRSYHKNKAGISKNNAVEAYIAPGPFDNIFEALSKRVGWWKIKLGQ